MPFLNENRPSFLGKQTPNTPQRNIEKSPISSHRGRIDPKPQVSAKQQNEFRSFKRYDFEKSLSRDRKLRTELAKKLNLPLNSGKVTEALEKIKKMLGKEWGGIIDPEESRSLLESPGAKQKRYWEERHELQKMAEGGVTSQESREIKVNKNIRDFYESLVESLRRFGRKK